MRCFGSLPSLCMGWGWGCSAFDVALEGDGSSEGGAPASIARSRVMARSWVVALEAIAQSRVMARSWVVALEAIAHTWATAYSRMSDLDLIAGDLTGLLRRTMPDASLSRVRFHHRCMHHAPCQRRRGWIRVRSVDRRMG